MLHISLGLGYICYLFNLGLRGYNNKEGQRHKMKKREREIDLFFLSSSINFYFSFFSFQPIYSIFLATKHVL